VKTDQDNQHMKFSTLNADFSSPSADRLGSTFKEACARERRRGVPLYKVVIFLILARLARKQLQIGTDILLIETSTDNELLSGVNIDDLE